MAYFVMAITASRSNSVTYDEVAHIVGGYVQWMCNDFRMNPENGMVAQRIATLPLCLREQRLPPLEQSWRGSDEWTFGRQFLFESGNDADRIVLYGRAMIALVSCATGLCVFLFSRRLFGTAGGLLSLALFAFCPTMLSHGALLARIGIPGGDSQYNVADVFRNLRLARLCAYLRHRRPDAMVGYAILIFNLSDDDLRAALLDAPAELVE